uniref:Uncharacterized protein n=1 Tax=Onchocerca volvulus TaxID=6282 RepID=A0A8R1XPN1_ONCVO
MKPLNDYSDTHQIHLFRFSRNKGTQEEKWHVKTCFMKQIEEFVSSTNLSNLMADQRKRVNREISGENVRTRAETKEVEGHLPSKEAIASKSKELPSESLFTDSSTIITNQLNFANLPL